MQETNKESYFSRCFTLSGEPLPEISHTEPVRIMKEESSHRDIAYENMMWFLEKYLHGDYTEKKIQEDNQMSYMIGFNTEKYAVLASESRQITTISDQTFIRDDKRKIFSCPRLSMLVGYVGLYSYRGDNIESIIEQIFEHSKSIENAFQTLTNLAWEIQQDLQIDQHFSMHIMYSYKNQIHYEVIDNDYTSTKTTYARKAMVIQSGAVTASLADKVRDDYFMEESIDVIKGTIKEAIERKKHPSIGGRIQCFVLKVDGSIVSFSE